jgi:hypothetical protein
MRFISLLPLLGLWGCFSPSIGDTPFRCAKSGDKLCPDGYTCRDQICIREGSDASMVVKPDRHILTDAELLPSKEGMVFLDGATVKSAAGCRDESYEPNNTGAAPVNGRCEVAGGCATPITQTGSITDWELCYPGDVDQYAVKLNAGQTITVKVIFQHANGDLDAALVDPTGQVIATSRGVSDNEQLKAVADVSGRFVFGVYGFAGAVNRYDLNIDIH